jgi:replication-associated recombination protein RarA
MALLNIHQPIIEKLKYFHEMHKIPNIIFHGQSGSGKRTIVNDFINIIYNNDKERIKSFVMYVNCVHGKGIKFIREELKFFSKTHINSNGGNVFKSIVLLNADKLTIDAQSALRRCIELFSHTTRFFIIVEDKYKLLKPILSRFCEIYLPEPIIDDKIINLYKYNLEKTFDLKNLKKQRTEWLKKNLQKMSIDSKLNHIQLIDFSTKLYEKGYSGLDLIKLLESSPQIIINNNTKNLSEDKLCEFLFAFNKTKKEFRNEKLIILFILNFLFLSLEHNLENISFI